MSSVKVSVVMPAYNEEEYIMFAIESILNQKYSNFEFIIVDDGSTDRTRDIIRSFDDKRIQLLEGRENRGSMGARNMGLEYATGDYIATMDADDFVHPNRLQAQVRILNANSNISIVGSNMYFIDNNNRIISEVDYDERPLFNVEFILTEGAHISHGSSMIRKSVINSVGGYRTMFKRAGDLDLWLRLAEVLDEDCLYNIPKRYYFYRIDGGQLFQEVTARSKKYRLVAQEAARLRHSGQKESLALNKIRNGEKLLLQNESNMTREAYKKYSEFRWYYMANDYYSSMRSLVKPKLNIEFTVTMFRLMIYDLIRKLRR